MAALPKKRLGDMLIEEGLIDEHQLRSALANQRQWGGRIGANLVKLGFLTEASLIKFLSRKMGFPAFDFGLTDVPGSVVHQIKEKMAQEYNIIPVGMKKEGSQEYIYMAMSDPTNLNAIDAVTSVTRKKVRPVVASDSGITEAIDFYYRGMGLHPVEARKTQQKEQAKRSGGEEPPPEIIYDEQEQLELVGDFNEEQEKEDGEDSVIFFSSKGEKQLSLDGKGVPAPMPKNQPAPQGGAPDKQTKAGADFIAMTTETRAMVVTLAKMLIEKGIVDQEEFFQRFKVEKHKDK